MTGKSLAKWSLAQRIRSEHDAPADGEAERQERQCAEDGEADRTQVHRAGRGQSERDRDDDPAGGVLEDRGGNDDLADVAAHEIHLAHHHRHDLDRGDRQRGRQEQGGDEARLRRCGSSESGSSAPSAKPQMKGSATPAAATAIAERPTRRTSRRSVSMPVSSSRRRMPSCETASSMPFCSAVGGNSACCRCGEMRPSSEGPSSSPPRSWPITAGWPNRCISSPSARPTSSRTPTWAKKIAAEAPGNLAFRGQSDRGGAAEQGRCEQDGRQRPGGRKSATPARAQRAIVSS